MLKTPEGKIKDKVKITLDKYGCYYFMPVSFGHNAGLDFHCCVAYRGWSIAFFIETKALDKSLTPRQQNLREKLITRHKAHVFVIDDDHSLKELERWLTKLTTDSGDKV